MPPRLDPLGLVRIIDGKLCLRPPEGDLASLPMPQLLPQKVDVQGKEFTTFSHTRKTWYDGANKVVLFFEADERCRRVAGRPWDYLGWIGQFYACATPDLSLYPDMSLEEQFLHVYWSRLIGRMWQESAVRAIPTVSWSNEPSLSFCFNGILPRSTVAVSTLGVKQNAVMFARGFERLCAISDLTIISYDGLYCGMNSGATVIPVEHAVKKACRLAALRQPSNQLCLQL